jgi:hypothetical protein
MHCRFVWPNSSAQHSIGSLRIHCPVCAIHTLACGSARRSHRWPSRCCVCDQASSSTLNAEMDAELLQIRPPAGLARPRTSLPSVIGLPYTPSTHTRKRGLASRSAIRTEQQVQCRNCGGHSRAASARRASPIRSGGMIQSRRGSLHCHGSYRLTFEVGTAINCSEGAV